MEGEAKALAIIFTSMAALCASFHRIDWLRRATHRQAI